MTNHKHIVDGPDGEPTISNKRISIRGHYQWRITELVEEYGWEQAAKKVCNYCGAYIADEKENTDEIDYICQCDEPTPSTEHAPI